MRLSVLKEDYSYNILASYYAKVFVDGKEINRCVTADEERNYYVVYDDNFNLLEKYGKVEIYIGSKFVELINKHE
jgi:hypothetical protein